MGITENQLDELEQFFIKTKLPVKVQLETGIAISDVPRFIESHLSVLRNNGDKAVFEVFYQRLVKVKDIISQG